MSYSNLLRRGVSYWKRYGFKALISTIFFELARHQYSKYAISEQVGNVAFNIPEIAPIVPRPSKLNGTRLNLLIPSIEFKDTFGGVSTALRIFEKLKASVPHARILVTDAVVRDYDKTKFREYALSPPLLDSTGNSILELHDRNNITIDVAPGDVFLASAWWTAYTARQLIHWQREYYKLEPKPLFYIIQDYEPGFYPWSSRYMLAESTYKADVPTVAIFNTGILQEFFERLGYTFFQKYHFNPTINPMLLEKAKIAQKTKRSSPYQLFVYGRPSVPRNAFEIIIQGLHIWVNSYPNAKNWNIVSAGEKHPEIPLGNGIKLASVGKLTLEEYANELTRSSVGLSIMISPHPSYPPLEMAAFGLEVITNSFANKDLSEGSSSIISIQNLTPESIASTLTDACNRVWERNGAPAESTGSFDMSGSSENDVARSVGLLLR